MGGVVKVSSRTGALQEFDQWSTNFQELEHWYQSLIADHRIFHIAEYGAQHHRDEEALREIRDWRAAIDEGHVDELSRDMEVAQLPAEKRYIAKHLAALTASFPNAAKTDLKAFGAMLAIHVASKYPSAYAVERACWKLRETFQHIPTIAKVLATIEAQERLLEGMIRAVLQLPKIVAQAERQLEQSKQRERDQRERDAWKAPA